MHPTFIDRRAPRTTVGVVKATDFRNGQAASLSDVSTTQAAAIEGGRFYFSSGDLHGQGRVNRDVVERISLVSTLKGEGLLVLCKFLSYKMLHWSLE